MTANIIIGKILQRSLANVPHKELFTVKGKKKVLGAPHLSSLATSFVSLNNYTQAYPSTGLTLQPPNLKHEDL